jgi:hypothetical protein
MNDVIDQFLEIVEYGYELRRCMDVWSSSGHFVSFIVLTLRYCKAIALLTVPFRSRLFVDYNERILFVRILI